MGNEVEGNEVEVEVEGNEVEVEAEVEVVLRLRSATEVEGSAA